MMRNVAADAFCLCESATVWRLSGIGGRRRLAIWGRGMWISSKGSFAARGEAVSVASSGSTGRARPRFLEGRMLASSSCKSSSSRTFRLDPGATLALPVLKLLRRLIGGGDCDRLRCCLSALTDRERERPDIVVQYLNVKFVQ